MKRALLALALLAVVALPFVLRPAKKTAPSGDVDRVVIVTPHNEATRFEYEQAFVRWYRVRTGRAVAIDWRVLGGTSEIARFLEGEYIAGFRNLWVDKLGQPWSTEVQAASQNGRLPDDATALARAARAAFLASDVSCGIDVFFGGGTYDFERQATAGRLLPLRIFATHPEWFTDDVIPQRFCDEEFWDRQHLWAGTVLGSYGILYNRDSLRHLGFAGEPRQWSDLTDFRYFGEVALCDPTKSGSIAKAFENVLQQQMQRRWRELREASPAAAPEELERQAVREGWERGLRILQLVGANARYFTDTSQKPPIDVDAGNCAAGMCIDFYGRAQAEAALTRSGTARLGFVSPVGGTINSVDPVGILRGAPNLAVAELFVEFSLSMEGQRLWAERPGADGGPQRYALRRLPIRKDYYAHAEWLPQRSDPEANPFAQPDPLIYRPQWTAGIFREMAFVLRVMCQDTHPELREAWRAINAPGVSAAARERALAVLQDFSAVSYDRIGDDLKRTLGSRQKVDEVRLAKELGAHFRANYRRAQEVARGGGD